MVAFSHDTVHEPMVTRVSTRRTEPPLFPVFQRTIGLLVPIRATASDEGVRERLDLVRDEKPG
jgi:hypothetical protein